MHFGSHAHLMHSNAQAKPQRNEKKTFRKPPSKLKFIICNKTKHFGCREEEEANGKCNWNASYGTSAVHKITEACEKCFSFTAFYFILLQLLLRFLHSMPPMNWKWLTEAAGVGPPEWRIRLLKYLILLRVLYWGIRSGLSAAIMWHEAANWSAKWVAASWGRVRTWQVLSRVSPSPGALTSCPGNPLKW